MTAAEIEAIAKGIASAVKEIIGEELDPLRARLTDLEGRIAALEEQGEKSALKIAPKR